MCEYLKVIHDYCGNFTILITNNYRIMHVSFDDFDVVARCNVDGENHTNARVQVFAFEIQESFGLLALRLTRLSQTRIGNLSKYNVTACSRLT